MKKTKKDNKTSIIQASIKKLEIIINQINAKNFQSSSTISKEVALNLFSLSVTDYIKNLVKEKRLTDPLLISRFVYIELSKVLYYDISYVKQNDLQKKQLICNTQVDPEKEKIFSYVVCTQWLQLYSYILNSFDIKVRKMNIPGQDHVWGEIRLSNDRIAIVDATDYIDSSIDLSNAKSMSPTVGFVVLPDTYSGIKLYDVFHDRNNIDLAKKVKSYYELNRELDKSLGYITKKGYKVENIIEENDIFNYSKSVISDKEDLKRFSDLTTEFFKNLKIPNNIDGYEVFAYYQRFIKHLPANIAANLSQQTMYVDSFSYKQDKMSKKFLHAPSEYLKYLENEIYRRYYKYLSIEENNIILENIRNGATSSEKMRDLIASYELKIAQINRNLNLYYAINKIHFYEPYTSDTLAIQLYEPMMGTQRFQSCEEFDDFKKKMVIK